MSGKRYTEEFKVAAVKQCSFARRIDPLCLTRLPLPGKRYQAVL